MGKKKNKNLNALNIFFCIMFLGIGRNLQDMYIQQMILQGILVFEFAMKTRIFMSNLLTTKPPPYFPIFIKEVLKSWVYFYLKEKKVKRRNYDRKIK